jgi:hypothetical protein
MGKLMTTAESTQNAYTIMFRSSLHTLSQYSKTFNQRNYDRCSKHAKPTLLRCMIVALL